MVRARVDGVSGAERQGSPCLKLDRMGDRAPVRSGAGLRGAACYGFVVLPAAAASTLRAMLRMFGRS